MEELRTTVDRINRSTDATLADALQGRTADEIKDAIIDADLGDNDALAAYDRLHAVTTFGRAF
jgi:hypothetical protein